MRGWDLVDARVVCQQLGFVGAVSTSRAVKVSIPEGSGTIWISGAQCKGSEGSIGECSLEEAWGMTHCSHSEDVAVECTGQQQ